MFRELFCNLHIVGIIVPNIYTLGQHMTEEFNISHSQALCRYNSLEKKASEYDQSTDHN